MNKKNQNTAGIKLNLMRSISLKAVITDTFKEMLLNELNQSNKQYVEQIKQIDIQINKLESDSAMHIQLSAERERLNTFVNAKADQ